MGDVTACERMVKNEMRRFTKEEVKEEGLMIVEGKVYDLTNFRHPGGKVNTLYMGEDATDAFAAFHRGPRARSFLPPLLVGEVEGAGEKDEVEKMNAAFRKLRAELVAEGWFKAPMGWFTTQLVIILALEVAGICASYAGASVCALEGDCGWTGWGWYVLAAGLLGLGQLQSGWLQHDYGHLSVTEGRDANIVMHKVLMAGLKGASSPWWRSRHNRHHAKPNHLSQDPDVHNEPLFLFDECMDEDDLGGWWTPFQGWYWAFLGPPLVTTVVFFITNIVDCVKRGLWFDLAIGLSFLPRFALVHSVGVGAPFASAVWLYFAMRFIESMWFTWVTAMNHFPMQIVKASDQEKKPRSWVEAQFAATQNLTSTPVLDWMSGHLNFQIEHHLFPQMPRVHYPSVAGRVKDFARDVGLDYRCVGFGEAAASVVGVLNRVASRRKRA